MICSRCRTQFLIFICLYSFLMNLRKTTCYWAGHFYGCFSCPLGKGNSLLLTGVSFRQVQYQETDYLFWAISPQPLRHILSYLNFRMMSFWCLKSKAFYISLARLFRNREVFPWNVTVYLWQGGQWTNYPYLYLYLSLYVQMMDYRERYSPKINDK